MEGFHASLVREKVTFVPADLMDAGGEDMETHTLRSNRFYFVVKNEAGTEKIAVRAQTMHVALLVAAKILFSFYRNGLFHARETAYDWDSMWKTVISSYEKTYNPRLWANVYINGEAVFKTNASAYVDIIEKCALLNADDYEASISTTEGMLKKIGHAMRIGHSYSVASIVTDHPSAASTRCGIIHRASGKTRNFSLSVEGGESHHRIVAALTLAASYLEALNLCYLCADIDKRMRAVNASATAPEGVQLRAARARIGVLNKTILGFEDQYDVKYRPGRPDLFNHEGEFV